MHVDVRTDKRLERRRASSQVPMLGVIARTPRGRAELEPSKLGAWLPAAVTAAREAWWVDRAAGVALFRPHASGATGGRTRGAALALRTHLLEGGCLRQAPRRADGVLDDAEAEVLLEDLVERDLQSLAGLRGKFALAIWDAHRSRLMVARDHLGHMSVFLRTTADYLIFGSDIDLFLRAGGVSLNAEAAFHYLAFGTPPPGQTLAAGLTRLPAAHALAWEPGTSPRLLRYWTPLVPGDPVGHSRETVARLRTTLDRAIARCTPRRAPIGLFLSGGVDSTYIAATVRAQRADPMVGFTSSFEARIGINETAFAAIAAEQFGLEHQVVPVAGDDAIDCLEQTVLTASEPRALWADITHDRLLAAASRCGVTRMLSGLGADEVFGGYDHFRGYYARFLRFLAAHPRPEGIDDFGSVLMPERQSARRVLYPGVARLFSDSALRRYLHPPYRNWHYASHLRAFYRETRGLKPEADPMQMMVAHECQHRIPDLLLANFEPLSAPHGTEVFYPFLDPDVAAAACALSIESRYRTPQGRFSLEMRRLLPRYKYTMMRVAEDRVPEPILARVRESYTAPFGAWLCVRRHRQRLLGRLRRSRFWEAGIVRREALDAIVAGVVPRPKPPVFQVWGLLTLAAWFDRYVTT
jgi:asparagine synthase (glutamine-hydrolysing)